MFVQGKGLFGHLDGSSTEPTDDAAKIIWTNNDAKVVTWLLNSVQIEIAIGLRAFVQGADMWSHLRRVYAHQNLARSFDLERTLTECRQGEMDVTSFYSKLLLLWMEQDQVIGADVSPAVLQAILAERKQSRVVQFLMKLRPEFENTRSHILNQEHIPELNTILSDVLREEIRLQTQATLDGSSSLEVAMATSHFRAPAAQFGHGQRLFPSAVPPGSLQPASATQVSRPVQCFTCHELGHVAKYCKKRNFCNYCKIAGHIISDCKKRPSRNPAHQRAYQTIVAQPSSFDKSEMQKFIQESIATAFSALTTSFPESIDREDNRQGE